MGKPEGGNHFEDLDVDGRIILKRIFEKWDGGTDWIILAWDKERWGDLVKGIMNFLDFIKCGEFPD
jgi:hypothetical protein